MKGTPELTEIKVILKPLCQAFSQELGRQVEWVEVSQWKKGIFHALCLR